MDKNYMEELEECYTPLLAIEEAARCLLCNDAPCSQSCPAGTDPGKFIRSLRFRNLKGAIETIRTNNVLGGICSRICPTEKYCQLACSRTGIDKPIEIGKLQQFLTDYGRKIKFNPLKASPITKEKIAIIGSGPAGLAASAKLAQNGYDVTIFEKNEKFGGWLRYGIPPFRLGEDIIDYEISLIKNLGVKFINNFEFTKDMTINSLENNGFKAILIATGYDNGRMLPLFDKSNKVINAVDFLREIKSNETKRNIEENILIIGGGDVALDAATSAKLLGATNVKVVARENMDNFPASKGELKNARELNISIFDGFTPLDYSNDKVTFINDSKDTMTITPDKIILAVGQVSTLPEEIKTCKKSSVFFAGDIAQGDKTVVYAIKSGKEAADNIMEYLGGDR